MTRSPLHLLASLLLVAGCGGSASSGTDGSAAPAAGGSDSGGSGGSTSQSAGGSAGTTSTGGSNASAGMSATAGTGGSDAAGGADATGGMSASGGQDTAGGAAGASAGAAGQCDTGVAPSPLPTITGQFVQVDATHMPPMQTGGDPTGTWVFDKATVYMPTFAAGLVNTDKSSATGTAWARFDAMDDYAVQAQLALSLSTLLGSMMMMQDLSVTGTFTLTGAMVNGTPTCGSMGSSTTIELTRTSMTDGTFLVGAPIKTAVGSGTVYVLLEGTITP